MEQPLINWVFTAFGATLGWLVKVLWDAIKDLKTDLKLIEREVHTNYVSKDDYRQDILEVKEILKQIFDKLDKKVDK